MAGPMNNLNAIKNGNRLNRMIIGTLPPTMRRQTANARRYRRSLEELVIIQKGEVTVSDAHIIDTCTACELHAAICRWLLRDRMMSMKPTDILACSRNIVMSKESRDRAFRLLKLDKSQSDELDNLYSVPSIPVEEPDPEPEIDLPDNVDLSEW